MMALIDSGLHSDDNSNKERIPSPDSKAFQSLLGESEFCETSSTSNTGEQIDKQAKVTSKSTNLSRRSRRKEDKECRVCGDRALGYNFDAITCESCKAFFRRNAHKDQSLACMFKDECAIDPNTRRFCSSCRLRKCFEVGMNKDMILDDEERLKRIAKVEANRAKKKKVDNSGLFSHEGIVDAALTGDAAVAPTTLLEAFKREFSSSDVITSGYTCPASAPELQNNSLPLLQAQLQFPLNACDASSTTRQLSRDDLQTIEVVDAMYFSTLGSTAAEVPLQPESTNLEALINHFGFIVKLLIQFAKKLSTFSALPQPVQIALLKGTLLHCCSVRSAQLYSIEKGCWVTQEGQIVSSTIMNAAFQNINSEIQREHIRLIKEMKSIIKNDLTIFSLLQCITLYSPECSCDGSRTMVANIQDYYIILLKHYLESNYSFETALAMLPTLLQLLRDIKKYNEQHSQAFLRADSESVEPLVREILNL